MFVSPGSDKEGKTSMAQQSITIRNTRTLQVYLRGILSDVTDDQARTLAKVLITRTDRPSLGKDWSAWLQEVWGPAWEALYDYDTDERLRPATPDEWAASKLAEIERGRQWPINIDGDRYGDRYYVAPIFK